MNQGRLWTVVSPNVGLPLLIGSVAVTSLIVHYSVMTHTTWMSAFFQGGMKKSAQLDTNAPAIGQANAAFTVSVAPVVNASGKGETSFVVTVTPSVASAPAITVGDASPPKSE